MKDLNVLSVVVTAALSGVVAAAVSGSFILYAQRSTESARQHFVQV